jgi:hypothetical protein
MRRLLRRIGARTGIALGLVVAIAVVLTWARVANGPSRPTPPHRGDVTLPSVAATAGADGVDVTASATYSDDSSVLAAATAFATAWLNRTLPANQWLDGMRPYATPELIGRLTGVDPLDVPESATLGQPAIRGRSDLYAEVLVPIETGDALDLGIALRDGHWVVATLDRETG